MEKATKQPRTSARHPNPGGSIKKKDEREIDKLLAKSKEEKKEEKKEEMNDPVQEKDQQEEVGNEEKDRPPQDAAES